MRGIPPHSAGPATVPLEVVHLLLPLVSDLNISDALNSIHEAGLGFVDLHPGIILIQEEGGEWKAKLVDF